MLLDFNYCYLKLLLFKTENFDPLECEIMGDCIYLWIRVHLLQERTTEDLIRGKLMLLMQFVFLLLFFFFFRKSIGCGYTLKLPLHVQMILMSTHNICIYRCYWIKVHGWKTQNLIDCALLWDMCSNYVEYSRTVAFENKANDSFLFLPWKCL